MKNPTFSAFSLLCLLGGPVVALIIGSACQAHDGSGAAWAPVGLFVAIFVLTGELVLGTGLAVVSIRRRERWPLFSWSVLILNALPAGLLLLLILGLFAGFVH